MEDIFDVSRGDDHQRLTVGTVSGGIDGRGHLGFAAQPGLRPFGRDVFNNPRGRPLTIVLRRLGGLTAVVATVLVLWVGRVDQGRSIIRARRARHGKSRRTVLCRRSCRRQPCTRTVS